MSLKLLKYLLSFLQKMKFKSSFHFNMSKRFNHKQKLVSNQFPLCALLQIQS